MIGPLVLSLVLAVSPPADERTLWLIQPLYPRQDAIIPPVEHHIEELFAGEGRGRHIIGRHALQEYLQGRTVALDCVFRESPCGEPRVEVLDGLGVDQIILVKAGQETESRFVVRVLSLGRESAHASVEASGTTVEEALRLALVKTVGLAATLSVRSIPSGAEVFIDGQKVGTTPFDGQVLVPKQPYIEIKHSIYTPVTVRHVIERGRIVVIPEQVLPILGLPPRAWGYVFLGAGALTCGAGILVGADALGKAQYTREIPQLNEADYQSAVASARSSARIADGLFISSLVAGGLGASILFWTNPGREPGGKALTGASALTAGLSPLPQGGAVTLGGRFP